VSTAIVFPAELIQRLLGPTYLARFLVPHDANFPSVHVVYAIASWGFLAVLAARHGRREIVVVLGLMTLAMGVLRVTVAAHFPSDVVAGYLLGGAWLLLVLRVSSTTSWTARG
jgi:undecaprenyl-diphosphatase